MVGHVPRVGLPLNQTDKHDERTVRRKRVQDTETSTVILRATYLIGKVR